MTAAPTSSTDAAFLADFHHVASIGATDNNGVDRQALTPEDKATRDWMRDWAARNGFDLRIDAIGNMFACLQLVPESSDTTGTPTAPYVLIGSHLDSQPLGGRFDGAYGVIAALFAALRVKESLAESGQVPEFNLAVVNWFNEEGGRFAPSIMGSSVYAGLFDLEEMLAVEDLEGTSVAEALKTIGYAGTDTPPEAISYAEIHIEQGRILEREATDIGVVEASWYTQKLDIDVLGEQSHTGATAMADRHDALVAASKVVLAVAEVVNDFEDEALVSSVGQHVVEPNSPIVVPRRVHMVADLRSSDPAIVTAARDRLRSQIAEIARDHDITIDVADFDLRDKRHFPETGVELAEKSAANEGLSIRRLETMAGHDSVAMNHRVPAVMMFVPSVDGVSHCEREFTTDEDMVRGLRVLTNVATELVGGELGEDRNGEVWVGRSVAEVLVGSPAIAEGATVSASNARVDP
ncbi:MULTISPECIES: M20 family metallo-hydrolase [unclassified Brevibacterium]|uniref:M20 family metallo-hydrolase n=1 Tax=unclassified Brevibacterium TaxID=2614124 RepID=UPI001E3AAB5E|nr:MULTISPECIES: M20 family metallo-hydrolase [unclassified Brevibacterium]MCD1287757.1 Zn-dependent hydrolase [Brevibacterium sp. CCUG 69071]MDK8433360.1 M20 family metallo-hydrolase [Brevibacterium sp. H-BE7]